MEAGERRAINFDGAGDGVAAEWIVATPGHDDRENYQR